MMNGHKGEKSVAAGKEVVVQLVLRFVSLVASVVAFSSMLTASQSSAVSIFGFQLDVSSQWSYSYAFE